MAEIRRERSVNDSHIFSLCMCIVLLFAASKITDDAYIGIEQFLCFHPVFGASDKWPKSVSPKSEWSRKTFQYG